MAGVVRNMTSRPIHLAKGKIVARVQAANLVPEATPSPELLKKLEADSPAVDKPQLTVKERQELLLIALRKDGGLDRLKDWPPGPCGQGNTAALGIPLHILPGTQ